MYTSSYYKLNARDSLKGHYMSAFAGALIFVIPIYLLYLVETLLMETGSDTLTQTSIIDLVFNLFLSNIFTVGFIRFLMSVKNMPEPDGETPRKYDYNLVLSGFTNNFKNTVKTTVLMNIYLLGWILLAFVPYFVVIGIISYLAVTTGHITEIYNLTSQLFNSMSYDMMINLSDYIAQNCSYLPVMLLAASVISLILIIPVIRKSYEYSVIPFIIAQTPDMPSKDAFDLAKDMMTGHKWRFFCLQLSFIGYSVLISIILSATMSMPIYFLAQALLMPYMQMAYIHFYEMRRTSSDSCYNVQRSSEPEHYDFVRDDYKENENL